MNFVYLDISKMSFKFKQLTEDSGTFENQVVDDYLKKGRWFTQFGKPWNETTITIKKAKTPNFHKNGAKLSDRHLEVKSKLRWWACIILHINHSCLLYGFAVEVNIPGSWTPSLEKTVLPYLECPLIVNSWVDFNKCLCKRLFFFAS